MIVKSMHCNARGVTVAYEKTGSIGRFNYEVSSNKPTRENNRYQLNPVQQRMYDVLMKGEKAYEAEVLSNMSPESRKVINKVYNRAQFVLQKLKYDTYYGPYDRLINNVLRWAGAEEQYLLGNRHTDFYDLPREVTLNSLHITETQIIPVFIEHELLPKNFYELSPASVEL